MNTLCPGAFTPNEQNPAPRARYPNTARKIPYSQNKSALGNNRMAKTLHLQHGTGVMQQARKGNALDRKRTGRERTAEDRCFDLD